MTGGVDPAVIRRARLDVADAIVAELATDRWYVAPVQAGRLISHLTGQPMSVEEERHYLDGVRRGMLRAAVIASAGPDRQVDGLGVVVEHGLLMSSGGYLLRNPGAHVEAIYPLQRWLDDELRNGSTIRRRTVIVVEDWADLRRGSGDRG